MAFLRFVIENRLFLLAGALLSFASSFGQTFFISIFAGQIQADFGLSDGAWGGIYTLGTATSALLMLWAGILTDRFRVRDLAVYILVALAAACLLMSAAGGVAMLTLVIFLLRFLGQGMTSQLAIVSMARWFVARRGAALSIAFLGFAAGQAILPYVFVSMMGWLSWRTLWVVAAGVVLVALPVLLVLLSQERSPRGLAEDSSTAGLSGRHWTRGEMLRHPLFWMLVPMLLGPPAWGTALFFQQVHLTEVKGWALVDFVALIPLFTLTLVASTFASGWMIDRFGARTLVPVYLVPFALSFLILSVTPSLSGAALALVVFGVGSGIQTTLPSAFWTETYGTRHLGSLKAVTSSVMVLGSAIGPGISGALVDLGYDFPLQLAGYAVYFLAAGALATLSVARLRTAPTSPHA